jgi:hypothetical protein
LFLVTIKVFVVRCFNVDVVAAVVADIGGAVPANIVVVNCS